MCWRCQVIMPCWQLQQQPVQDGHGQARRTRCASTPVAHASAVHWHLLNDASAMHQPCTQQPDGGHAPGLLPIPLPPGATRTLYSRQVQVPHSITNYILAVASHATQLPAGACRHLLAPPLLQASVTTPQAIASAMEPLRARQPRRAPHMAAPLRSWGGPWVTAASLRRTRMARRWAAGQAAGAAGVLSWWQVAGRRGLARPYCQQWLLRGQGRLVRHLCLWCGTQQDARGRDCKRSTGRC